MPSLNKKRKQLFQNLIKDGYFRDADGSVNFSESDFCQFLDKEGVAERLYQNLLNDGYFLDEDGAVNLTQESFVEQLTREEAPSGYYPVTENQRGIYIDWEQHRDTVQYNTPACFRFSKDRFQPERMLDALKTAVNSHPYVKTRLALRDGDVVQLQRNDAEIGILFTKLDDEPDENFFQARVQPFDLFNDDLFRLEIYETESCFYIFQDFHHIVFDGMSAGVFLSDALSAYYGNDVQEEDATSFDFALRESEKKGSEQWDKACEYFDSLLSDAGSIDYPDSTCPESASKGESGHLLVPIGNGNAIKDYCREYGLTESNFFLTVMLEVLSRITREENIQACFISNGRNDRGH